VQHSVADKGTIVCQVLLPAAVGQSLLSLRGDAGANDPVFASSKGKVDIRKSCRLSNTPARAGNPAVMRLS
jgi:hypothetical protein